MTTHTLGVDELWRIPRVGAPAPAPDGTWAVVPVTEYDMEANEGITRLWRVTRAGEADPLTNADASAEQPAVAPAADRVAFVRKPGAAAGDGIRFGDRAQLYVMSLSGGEPERLTDTPLGIEDPRWFPDGQRIAFLSPVFREALSLEATAARLQELEDDPVQARVTEDNVYRYWDRWLTDGKVHHIFVLDLKSGTITDLAPDNRRWLGLMDFTGLYDVAPDGGEVAFQACKADPPYAPPLFGVYTVGTEGGGSPRPVAADHPSNAFRPRYSPDGHWLVFGIQREDDFYADRVRLVAAERATGSYTVLTESWALSAQGWTFNSTGDPSLDGPLRPGTLFFAAEVKARRVLHTLDVAAARDGEAEPVPLARDGWLGDPKVAGDHLFVQRHALAEPPEVLVGALDGGPFTLRPCTSFTEDVMSQIELGEVDDVTLEGAGGERVQMFVVHPPAPAAGGADDLRPLVHLVHGGPHGTFGDAWHFRWNPHTFAAPGYVVALVNFHGSTGWGQEFTASILGRWGDQPYEDVMAATDWLVEHRGVDPARMAVAGGSYGGYLVSWICSQTDRFACAVNHAGVSDFQTQFASDVVHGRPRSMGGEPWDNVAGMDRYNPMRHATGFATPMLVLHGEQDYRVPYDQGLSLYAVLRAKSVPARLVVYPDENHWILKPRNSRHWYGEVQAWLARWLSGAEGSG